MRIAKEALTFDDVLLIPGRSEVLRSYRDQGYLLLGISWQPAIADGSTQFAGSVGRLGGLSSRLLVICLLIE